MERIDIKEFTNTFYDATKPIPATKLRKWYGDAMFEFIFEHQFAKADQLVGTDTDTKNIMFGAAVDNWLNFDSELWQILPKRPAPRTTGYRVYAGEPSGTGASGLPEDYAMMGSQTLASFVNVNWDWKWHSVTFGASEKELQYSQLDDNVDYWSFARDKWGQHHVKAIDDFLARPISVRQDWYGVGKSGATGVAGATFIIAGLDQMISSSSEATTLTGITGLTGATNANVYPYGINLRRMGFAGTGYGNGPFDAVVDVSKNATATLVGADRPLDLSLLDGVIRAVEQQGARREALIIVTGYDTADAISDLLQARQRFTSTARIMNTLNGVQRVSSVGVDGGVDVMTYKGIPIFRSRAVQNLKGGSGLAPIFGIHTPDCYIAVGMPTLYLETGQSDWLLMGKLRRKAGYFTAAELIFTRFNRCFKVTQLAKA